MCDKSNQQGMVDKNDLCIHRATNAQPKSGSANHKLRCFSNLPISNFVLTPDIKPAYWRYLPFSTDHTSVFLSARLAPSIVLLGVIAPRKSYLLRYGVSPVAAGVTTLLRFVGVSLRTASSGAIHSRRSKIQLTMCRCSNQKNCQTLFKSVSRTIVGQFEKALAEISSRVA